MKIIYIILFSVFTTSLYADWRNQAVGKSLNDISKKTSKFVSGLIRNGADDEWNYRVTFVHPPKNNKKTLLDGAVAQEAFIKKNMKDTLKDKVRRNNNLAVEIQGSVIVTSK